MRRFAFLLVVAAGVSIAAKAKEDKKGSPADGTWLVTAIENRGEKLDEETLKKSPIKRVIAGDKWKMMAGEEVSSGTSKVDLTKKPAEIDVIITEGPEKGTSMKGILELKGDTMRTCFDGTGKERPKEFSTKGKPYILIEYRREKK